MPSYSRRLRYLHLQVSAIVVVAAIAVDAVVVVANVVVVCDHKEGSLSGKMPSYARGS